jgi:hypothetical protein
MILTTLYQITRKGKKTSREKWSNLLFNNADFNLPKRKNRKNKFEGRNGRAYFFTALPPGCRMGAEAVLALMDATADSEPVVVSLVGNKTVRYRRPNVTPRNSN